MWKLIIFDLDNTLIHSDHLEQFRGLENTNKRTRAYKKELLEALEDDLQVLISEGDLLEIQEAYPDASLAVITRSPRFYAETILDHVYPEIEWSSIIGYEDVEHTKPDPEGILLAIDEADIEEDELTSVVMIGDGDSDLRAAYRSGVWAFLYRKAWARKHTPGDWAAMAAMADAEITNNEELMDALEDPCAKLPCLEAHIASESNEANRALNRLHTAYRRCRLEGSEGKTKIFVCGRIFTRYQAISSRREWHALTELIDEMKEKTLFPPAVVSSMRVAMQNAFAEGNPTTLFMARRAVPLEILITCIPRKPDRPARMEGLITQLQRMHRNAALFPRFSVEFDAECFQFTDGVQSHHGEYLTADQRFENVRDHLELIDRDSVKGKLVIVIDDVLTTGATLYFSEKLLNEAGARSVTLIALAQSTGP